MRKFRTKVNQPKIDSFMFFGYPENWEVKDLWSLFKRHGWVNDIYMVKWRLKNGERFGFVRFRGVSDVKLMEKRLGNINIGNMKLKVFIASDRRSKNVYQNERNKGYIEMTRQREVKPGAWRDERSYRDVLHRTKDVIAKPTAGMSGSTGSCSKVVGNGTTEDIAQEIVEIEVENGRIKYLKKCVIGEVGEVESLDLAKSRLEADGREVEDIKLLGNLDILIKFKNERTVENVLKNKSLDVHQWLSNARKWVAGFSPDRRLVWLNIMGVPDDQK
ncbi:hypothetical protein CTI12_AA118510 [Artemisia annua]|uniref:RRM domain-containing protein n=1 Tax=Artemisia annua TaxID=35608 RepID=A0A2U1PSA4_ARTAN|nr:hypothetical protein CTI12_AA118510 [Artemisia annua]